MIFFHGESIKDLKLGAMMKPSDVPTIITKLGGDAYEWTHGFVGLNTRNEPIVAVLNNTYTSLRTEMRTICGASCAAFIHLVNNPKKQDREKVLAKLKELVQAGKIIGIELLDFVMLFPKEGKSLLSCKKERLF